MNTKLAAEALAAITGLWPKKPPDVSTLLSAEALPERWAGQVRRWLRSDGPARFQWVVPLGAQEKLRDRVYAVLDIDETAGWLTTLGDYEIGLAYAAILQKGREYLSARWPVTDIGDVLPDVLPLSADEIAELWSLNSVLDGPETVLDELGSYTLTTTQALACREVYPELTRLISDTIDVQLAEDLTRKRVPNWSVQDQIRVFRGLGPAVSLTPPTEDAPPAQRRSTSAIDFRATRTRGEDLIKVGEG